MQPWVYALIALAAIIGCVGLYILFICHKQDQAAKFLKKDDPQLPPVAVELPKYGQLVEPVQLPATIITTKSKNYKPKTKTTKSKTLPLIDQNVKETIKPS